MKTMRLIGIVLALFSEGSPPAAQAQDSGKKYKELFDEIAEGIDTASEKTYEFKERLSGRGTDKLNNTVLAKLKELKNYTDVDLKSIHLDTTDVVAGAL